MSERFKHTENQPKRLTCIERVIQVLLSEQSPALANALGTWIFRRAIDTGHEDSVISIAARLTESYGQLFFEEVGKHYGIAAVTFDFGGKHYPITVLKDLAAKELPTPVLWSKQVEWAQKKQRQLSRCTPAEVRDIAVILQIQRAFEKFGVRFPTE